MNFELMMRHLRRLALTTTLAAVIAQPALATCTMQTQMTNAQSAEQTRCLNNINTNLQTLTLLNQLETACLNQFQSIPTQWSGSSGMLSSAVLQTPSSSGVISTISSSLSRIFQ
ncbi:hypothetical protein PQR71_35275 [Paraburkholderia fungorum]|uniref:hypothetical protein n=1 Tax=Paraburkholderia fungorum TaxID=134537 RepID=UPI0038BB4DCC